MPSKLSFAYHSNSDLSSIQKIRAKTDSKENVAAELLNLSKIKFFNSKKKREKPPFLSLREIIIIYPSITRQGKSTFRKYDSSYRGTQLISKRGAERGGTHTHSFSKARFHERRCPLARGRWSSVASLHRDENGCTDIALSATEYHRCHVGRF